MTAVEISYSRIQTYQRCPWMYHLVYNLGWRTGPSSGTAMGLSLHRALEAYHSSQNTEKTLTRLWEFFDQVWVNEGFDSPQETLDAYDQGRKILDQYFHTDQLRTTNVISTEKEYTLALDEGIQFRWTLDRLDRRPDGSYEIIEYKSNPYHWNENRRDNDLQMTLYSFGMKKFLNVESIHLKYHFLSSNNQIEVFRTSEQHQAAEDLLKTVAEKIKQGFLSPNLDHCPKCEFANRCTKGKS